MKKVSFFILFISLLFLKSYGQSQDTVVINIDKTVYETNTVYDTILQYDTIFLERKITGVNVGLSYSPFFTNISGNSNSIFNNGNFSSSIGADLELEYNKISFGIGALYSSFSSDYKYDKNISFADSTFIQNIINNSFYQYDTTGIQIVIDTLSQDTSYIYTIDSTFIEQIDTTNIVNHFTNSIDTSVTSHYKFSYIEIPIMFRYELYRKDRFCLQPTIGFITGFLFKTEITTINTSTLTFTQRSKKELNQMIFSIWASLGFRYNLTDYWDLSIEPYYCFALNNMIKEATEKPIIPNKVGANFKIIYRF